jgi:dTDP-4-dehydrorhamnose 3,5-epimerase
MPELASAEAFPQARELPCGVSLWPLTLHADDRGGLAEIFRAEWNSGVEPVQWNLARTRPNVLRGMHLHLKHWDYVLVLDGRARFGLMDLRAGSPSEGLSTAVDLCGEHLTGIAIPPGVAHGFYFFKASVHLYGVSHYWDQEDELGCRWNDPGLAIEWPTDAPLLSARDREAGSLEALRALAPAYEPGTSVPGLGAGSTQRAYELP